MPAILFSSGSLFIEADALDEQQLRWCVCVCVVVMGERSLPLVVGPFSKGNFALNLFLQKQPTFEL